MIADRDVLDKTAQLDALTMQYETAVIAFPAEDYAEAFRAFFELRTKALRLILSPDGFHETLREVSGDDVWQPIAEKTERLFGLPRRVTILQDDKAVKDELEGSDGLGPFFFIFDLMFCEYDGFTLCFISGTNN